MTLTARQHALLATVDAPSAARRHEPAADTVPLVKAAQQGDRSAFDELHLRYVRMVHGILIARAPRTDVDDLVQDVFLHAFQHLPALRDPAAFGGWLSAIARNRATDYLRRAPEIEPLPDDIAASERGELNADTVMRVIRSLPEAYRETLVLRLVEGMTGPEIAAATGLTPASVRVNLHRGMKQLRERLEGSSARE
jgi:RNA polymerase sigma-70 factor, ECF subfamily